MAVKQCSVAASLVVLAMLAMSVHDVSAARPLRMLFSPLPSPPGPISYVPELAPSYVPELAPSYAPEVAPVYAPEMAPIYAPEVSPSSGPSYDVGPSPASYAPTPSSGA